MTTIKFCTSYLVGIMLFSTVYTLGSCEGAMSFYQVTLLKSSSSLKSINVLKIDGYLIFNLNLYKRSYSYTIIQVYAGFHKPECSTEVAVPC